MSSRFSYFEENDITLTGVIHVGAHRGEEVNEYEALVEFRAYEADVEFKT